MLAAPAWATTDPGLSTRMTNAAGNGVALYAESHALIIGVSDYTGGWPGLRGVEEDVPAVAAALERPCPPDIILVDMAKPYLYPFDMP